VKVAILGAGAAGSAAALVLQRSGIQACLVECAPFPRYRPGETLHPGIAPLLERLGVASVLERSTVRHQGTWVDWGGSTAFVPFGSDADGPWRGYQLPREILDNALLQAALERGAILLTARAHDILRKPSGAVGGIVTSKGGIDADYVFDCTGANAWLLRRLGVPLLPQSPALFASIGYASGDCAAALPCIRADRQGWTWLAQVDSRRYHWTRVTQRAARPPADWAPPSYAGLHVECVRGADVSWRIARRCAGPGWFACGDAAARLDPSSSHGVLHALMSGMMAAHMVARQAPAMARMYHDWLAEWFAHDSAELARNYRKAGLFGYAG
jgi:flavin-dependent dehydrogenase